MIEPNWPKVFWIYCWLCSMYP